METSTKSCECGCGQVTLTTREGRPQRFLLGHNRRGKSNPSGEANGNWRGGEFIDKDGYRRVRHEGRYVAEQILVVERVIGRRLPKTAQVHHVNENRLDNDPRNFVVCQSAGYHQLLHARLRALRACGDPNARPCTICHSYERQGAMYRHGAVARHRDCHAADIARRNAAAKVAV